MAFFSRATWVSQHQKGKPFWNLDFNEARNDGVPTASAGPYANHLHLAPDRKLQQHLTTEDHHKTLTGNHILPVK